MTTKVPFSSSNVDNSMVLEVQRVDAKAHLPVKGSDRSAGFDLHSTELLVLKPGERALVSTGLKIALPEGCYGRIAPRSGLAVKHGIDVGAGVVDEDYRGELKVVLFNFGVNPFTVEPGMRIAQLICEQIYLPVLKEVEKLSDTQRGTGGFGSTGTN